MAVYQIFASADASIYSLSPTQNAGRDPILEVSVLSSSPQNTTTGSDIRRSLIQFSSADLNTLYSFASQSISGSWNANLNLYLASAQNLNTTYSLYAYPVTSSWVMGTGQYNQTPISENGVCWSYTGPYSASNSWGTQGGDFTTSVTASQYFDYMSNKDINMDVTKIVNAWFSGSIPNDGIILKHPSSIENNSNSFIGLNFFSVDTHTIYPPNIQFKWADSYYFPQGTNYVLNDQITVTLSNNPGILSQNQSYKMRTAVRYTYPPRQFTTQSIYIMPLYLPENTCWALQDVKTEEFVINFDPIYTKLSADSVSNYFNLYTNGLEINRFYRILIQTNIYSTTYGPLSVYDNDQAIYNALATYGSGSLALLPTEQVIYTGQNLTFKVVSY